MHVSWKYWFSVAWWNIWMGLFTVRKEYLLFKKRLNCFNSFNTWCLAGLFLPQYCTVLILVCRKTCFTITAHWYTCTYSVLCSLSYIREQCDGGLLGALNSFPFLHHFHHNSKNLSDGPHHWMWLPWWWKQQELQECLCSYCSQFNNHLLKATAYTFTTTIAPEFLKAYSSLIWFFALISYCFIPPKSWILPPYLVGSYIELYVYKIKVPIIILNRK